MDWREYVRQHLTDITGDPARDEEIIEELAQHLASRFEEIRGAGASEQDALEQVAGELKSNAQLADVIRRAERLRPSAPVPPGDSAASLMMDLSKDVRYAVRLLRRTPGFTMAALLTLALGIGMTTAIFSVVEAVLLRPVPFPEPDRLVMMWETDGNSGTTREPASFPDFFDYRQRSRQFDRVGAFASLDLNLTSDEGEPQRVAALGATPELLDLLGVATVAGRSFTPEEVDLRPGGPQVVMISDRLWEQLFSRDPAAIGAPIRLNDAQAVIIGVVSPTADFGVLQILSAAAYSRGFADRDPRTRVDIWAPLRGDPKTASRGGNHVFLMVGRLTKGATVASARHEMSAIAADLERTYPRDNAGRGAFLEPLDDVVFGRSRTALTVLMVAVLLVLLIACINVANLLLARGTARVREVAVRAALGAGLPRLARQFVVENLVLALGATAAGVPFAYAVLHALKIVGPANVPRLATVSLDEQVLFIALVLSALIGLVFGILPVAQARRTDLLTSLKAEDGHGATSGRDSRKVRSALVIGEVALAVLLVTGAGLLMRSFWKLAQTDPGFDVTAVLKAEFQVSPARYPADPQLVGHNRLVSGLLDRIGQLPGVEYAGLAAHHPLDAGFTNSFTIVGREAERRVTNWPEISTRFVTPGYFRALRVPLVRGRFLAEADTSSSTPVVVVNQATAARFFAGRDPIGQLIQFWGVERLVVGVVGDERFQGIAKAPPIAVYAPLSQVRRTTFALIVRTATSDPLALAPYIRKALRDVDPELAVFGLEPLRETIGNSLGEQRFMMLLLGLFGFLAVALAAIGVHGVLTYLVAQRVREIGVRMALGATSGTVMRMIAGQGARLVGFGLATGLAGAIALGRFLSGQLFGVTPTDPQTLAAGLVVVGATAALSIWLPARRAVQVSPLTALRGE